MTRVFVLMLLTACADPVDAGLPTDTAADPYTRPGHPPADPPQAIVYGRLEWQAGHCVPVSPPDGALVQLLACDDLGRSGTVCRPHAAGPLSLTDGAASVLCADDGLHDSYVLTWIAPG